MATNAAMRSPKKRITRMDYRHGPMGFLADQIKKEMQRAGYAPATFCLYRSPEQQRREWLDGDSKARPYQSAHQYYAAADIICERWAWFGHADAPDGDPFWECLWDCVELVSEKFGVEFDPPLAWDRAHVELTGWEQFRSRVGERPPTREELDAWFAETLPRVWKQHLKSVSYGNR